MKIQRFTSSFKSVLVSTLCINRVSFIEILNLRTFSSKREILSKFVILDGVYKLTTVR